MSRPVYIYILIDPRDGKTKYVGQTVNFVNRFKQHVDIVESDKSLRAKWVNDLLSCGTAPLMCVVEKTTPDLADEREKHWIDKMLDDGCDLVNTRLASDTKSIYAIYLSEDEAAALKSLAAALGLTNQRGQPSLSALCQHLAAVVSGAHPETVAALKIAEGCAAGEDWGELIEIVRPLEN